MNDKPAIRLLTVDRPSDRAIREGGLVHANAVTGANIIRDMREAIVNTLGGHMTKYEAILDKTIDRALDALAARARALGYDGVVGVRISHPMITTGALEVVVCGTGFNYV